MTGSTCIMVFEWRWREGNTYRKLEDGKKKLRGRKMMKESSSMRIGSDREVGRRSKKVCAYEGNGSTTG